VGLEGYPVRTALACGARLARRVLPLVDLGNRPLCTVNISFGECVAAGEPIGFMRALDLGELPLLSRAQNGMRATAAQSAATAVGAAAIAVSQVIETISDFELVSRAREQSTRLLDAAFKDATKAAQLSENADDRDLAQKAFDADWRVLEQRKIATDIEWLGEPVNPGENGPFGLLWPSGTPSWYASLEKGAMIPKPNVEAGEKIEKNPELIDHVDIVCWHLEPKATAALNHVRSFIRHQVAESNKHHNVPRIFVVHVPGLAEEEMVELVMVGATVLRDPNVGDKIPKNSYDLVGAVTSLYSGWNRQTGQWPYTAAPSPTATLEHTAEELSVGEGPKYRSVVEDSRSLKERLESESGWPVDI
jgi:hypothetical protein